VAAVVPSDGAGGSEADVVAVVAGAGGPLGTVVGAVGSLIHRASLKTAMASEAAVGSEGFASSESR
jgi:hypothetical protein